MKIHYMNGAGNDFMVMDARGSTLDFPRLSARLCKLTGADGFMAVDDSAVADFRLHFYNADGSRGEMCGNGARCICRFAHDMGIAGDTMTVETDAGIVHGWRCNETVYRILLNNPGVLDLHRRQDAAYVELGRPGVPHSVTHIPGLRWEDRDRLRAYAKQLRFAPEFPKGVNANFYDWVNDSTIRILTYERGVEDYTLACGTGSASVAVVLWQQGKLPSGHLTVQNPGGDLTITITGVDVVENLFLDGDTQLVQVFDMDGDILNGT